MSNKEIVTDLLLRIPESASLQEIAQEIEFVAGVREGLESYEREGGVTLEEARARVIMWAQSGSK